MWTLRFEVLIRPEKRKEFLESLRTIPATDATSPDCHKTLQDVNDPSLIFWLAGWKARNILAAFLASSNYRALKDTISVLGHLQGEIVVESESTSSGLKGLEP